MILGDDIMPQVTAKWAREQSEQYMSDRVKAQLTESLNKILVALDDDERYVYVYKYLEEKVVSILQNRGFSVENCCSQKDGDAFKITW